MEQQSLADRLINEVKQTPGKAVVLGVGLVLATYMWLPLVWNWVPRENRMAEVTTGVASPNLESALSRPEPATQEESKWYQQYVEFEKTNVLKPWTPPTTHPSTPVEAAPEQGPQTVPLLTAADWEKLSLSAVLIGGRTGQLADLNGRVIREGDRLWINFSETNPVPVQQSQPTGEEQRWVPLTVQQIRRNEIDILIGTTSRTLVVRQSKNP